MKKSFKFISLKHLLNSITNALYLWQAAVNYFQYAQG